MENLSKNDVHVVSNDTRDHSLWVIQGWIKKLLVFYKAKKMLEFHKDKVKSVVQLLEKVKNAASIDVAQRILFPEPSMRLIVHIFSLFPKDARSKQRISDVMLARKIMTGVLMSLFGDDVVGNTSPGASRNVTLQAKMTAMRSSASTLHRQLEGILEFLAQEASNTPKLGAFRRLLSHFHACTRDYFQKFEEWKIVDAAILQQSMEETFAQSYQNFIFAKVAHHYGDVDDMTVQAAELQTDRLSDVLRQILGPLQATSRIEEIKASIEAEIPDYARIQSVAKSKTAENNSSANPGSSSRLAPVIGGMTPLTSVTPTAAAAATATSNASSSTISDVNITVNGNTTSATRSSNNPVVAAAAATATLVDTTELRRTITPIPADSLPLPNPIVGTSTTSNSDTSNNSDTNTNDTTSTSSTSAISEESTSNKTTTAAATAAAAASNLSSDESARYLQLLSKLAGIENERLAHELTLDQFFRLPEKKNRSSTTTVQAGNLSPAASLMHSLRNKMLNVLADKLINSLRPSTVSDLADLCVGDRVPVKVLTRPRTHSEDTAAAAAAAAAGNLAPPEYYTLTAEIVSIYHHVKTAKNDTAVAADSDEEKNVIIDEHTLVKVRYLSDNSEEDAVSITRIVTASDKPVPQPLLAALLDIAQAIAAFTPTKQGNNDLRQSLASLIDVDLLASVIVHGTLDPVRDILPIFVGLQRVLLQLHAEYRLENAMSWLKAFNEAFSQLHRHTLSPSATTTTNSTSSNTSSNGNEVTAASLIQQALSRYFPLSSNHNYNNTTADTTTTTNTTTSNDRRDNYQWMALIPLFLEHTTESLEDIQRDMANFYIAQLVPLLQTHGQQFLAQRFQERMFQGLVSLDRTAHLLQLCVSPEPLLTTHLQQQLPAPFAQIWSSVRATLGLSALNRLLKECDLPPFSTTNTNTNTNTSSSSSGTNNSNNSSSSSNGEIITLEMIAKLSATSLTSPNSTTATATAGGVVVVAADSSAEDRQQQKRDRDMVAAIVACAMCALLQLPLRLDAPPAPPSTNTSTHNNTPTNNNHGIHGLAVYFLPETFAWDATRLSALRDRIDVIALETGITLSVRQLLQQRFRVAHREEEEIELQHRLDILLTSDNNAQINDNNNNNNTGSNSISSSSEPVSMGNLVAEVVRYVEYALIRARETTSSTPTSTSISASAAAIAPTAAATSAAATTYDVREITLLVEKLLRDVVVAEDSPVIQLMRKRIYRLLLRALLQQPYEHLYASFSLQQQAQARNLALLISHAKRLLSHTLGVHGVVYSELLRAMAQKMLVLSSSSATATAAGTTSGSHDSAGDGHPAASASV